MITIQSRHHVPGIQGREILEFLANCTDEQYRAWWPGTHLALHTLARCPGEVGNIVYMDEFIGAYRVKMTGIVRAYEPGRKIVWQLKRGVALPVRLRLDLVDAADGVAIAHTIEAGFQGPGRLLDPLFRMFFPLDFERAMDEHVKAEFPMLRDLLRGSRGNPPKSEQRDGCLLADSDHPLVQATARSLTSGETTASAKLARLFLYVRDEIKFRFPVAGDLVKASETIRLGHGQCNTKGTLLLALCKAIGLPARIHFSLISKEIQRGFFTGPAYWLMPPEISHSWIEVEIDGRWRKIDTYINDLALHQGSITELRRRGWRTGFSVSLPTSGEAPAPNLDLEAEKYAQIGAVTDDHGTYDDPADYYARPLYRNRPSRLKLWLYQRMVGRINKRVQAIRQGVAVDVKDASQAHPSSIARAGNALNNGVWR